MPVPMSKTMSPGVIFTFATKRTVVGLGRNAFSVMYSSSGGSLLSSIVVTEDESVSCA